MKRIRSWTIIIVSTILACCAVGFLFVGAWWNSVIIACVCLLAYVIKNKKD